MIEGVAQEKGGYSKISLAGSVTNISFMIPRAQAGPLIVPKINYDEYLI